MWIVALLAVLILAIIGIVVLAIKKPRRVK
jgi:hypothetical protein